MSIIDVVKEEIENKNEWINLMADEILAKATLKVKKPYKKKYYYLHYYENGKTVDKYLGKLSNEEAANLKHKIAIMKKQKKKIPSVKKEIKLLNKVLTYAKTLKSKYKGAVL